MSLSDLDLVQQAMAPSEPGAQTRNAPSATPANGTAATDAAEGENAADPLADIDMSKLTDEDRKMLQPMIDALRAASTNEQGDERDIDDILKQLDQANNVADSVEGRLDKLLSHLNDLESSAATDASKTEEECKEAKKTEP